MTEYESRSWRIAGSDGELILGNTHEPALANEGTGALGVVLLVHGFLGYKDYGLFPYVAAHLASAGFIVHRFNFSHSGMTNRIKTFERPDLFEKDTWGKQVHDVGQVVAAIDAGELSGAGLPYVLYGHSRGGVTVLLTAARRFHEGRRPMPAGVFAAAAPSFTRRLSEEDQAIFFEQGYQEVVSGRTGQTLRVGASWLSEQLDDPARYDLSVQVGRIGCPVMLVHGEKDSTVPASCAGELADWVSPGVDCRAVVVPGGDHVFNTPNPMPADGTPSEQLSVLIDELEVFSRGVCGG